MKEIKKEIAELTLSKNLQDVIESYIQDGDSILYALGMFKRKRYRKINKKVLHYWDFYTRGKQLIDEVEQHIKTNKKKLRMWEDTPPYLMAVNQLDEMLIELEEWYITCIYNYQSMLSALRKKSIQTATNKNQACFQINCMIQMKNTIQEYLYPKTKNNFLCLEVSASCTWRELVLNLEVMLMQTTQIFIYIHSDNEEIENNLKRIVKTIVDEDQLSVVCFCKCGSDNNEDILPFSWMKGVGFAEISEEDANSQYIDRFMKRFHKTICKGMDVLEISSYTLSLLNIMESMHIPVTILMDFVKECILQKNYHALYIVASILAEKKIQSEVLYVIIKTYAINGIWIRELKSIFDKIKIFDYELYRICIDIYQKVYHHTEIIDL